VEGVHQLMTAETVRNMGLESELSRRRVIQDLETGSEYPYLDDKSAAAILVRLARTENCSVSQVLETVWVLGCSKEEFRSIAELAKNG